MKDAQGLYYYPDPSDPQTRMYVRQGGEGVEFRLWRQNFPVVWEKHGWLPYKVVSAAAELYQEQKGHKTPLSLYDLRVAEGLLRHDRHNEPGNE